MGQLLVLYRRKSEKFRIFHEATRLNDIEKLEKLLKQGISASCQDEKGRTPLHHAADLGMLEMLEFLISKGAQSNLVDVDQNTALHFAVLFWNEFSLETKELIVEMLLEKGMAQCNSQNRQGRTPLHYAAAWNQKKIVRLLRDNGAQMNILDHEGKTALFWAMDKRRDEILPILTRGGAWLYERDEDNPEKITIFLGPAKGNSKMFINIFLQKIVQRRIQNQLGNLAPQGEEMHVWNVQIAHMLLKQGARPCERQDVESILLLAFSYTNEALFQLLFDAGCMLHLVHFESNLCGTVYQLAQSQGHNQPFVHKLVDIFYEHGIIKPGVAAFITHKDYKPHPLKTQCRTVLLKLILSNGGKYEDIKEFQPSVIAPPLFAYLMGEGSGVAQRMHHPFMNDINPIMMMAPADDGY